MSSETFCSYYNLATCRSCEWIESAYSVQIAKKEETLRNALFCFPQLPLELTAPSKPIGFRNRAKLSVTGTSEIPTIGLLGEEELDQGRELLHCPLHHPKMNEVISELPNFIREFNLIPYQIKSQIGELKGLILFYSEDTHELYLRFVLRSKECVSRVRKLLPKLQAKFPYVKCVSCNLQPIPHAILEGKEEIFVTEQSSIRHELAGLSLKLAPQAFVQTNALLASELYQTAARWIHDVKPRVMLDLFCGQGPFSFFAEGSAQKIIGIEINSDAVKTANETASERGVSHLSFECVDVSKAHERFLELNPDLVLVNPPRRGMGDEGVKMLLSKPPEYLVYSSCSVESLAKDLSLLSPFYDCVRAKIFDLFPHTSHFETLLFLKLKVSPSGKTGHRDYR